MYKAESELTKQVCEKLGFIYSIRFVETMERNGKVYVRGTAGKPDEFKALKHASEAAGYIYKASK